jgi:hypothetical protein
MDILDAKSMIARQGITRGGEEHGQIMEGIIKMIQNKGNFPFVPIQVGSFDVGEIETDVQSKYLWNYKSINTYEAQTNAIKEELDNCIERSKAINSRLIFAAGNEKVGNAILQITNQKFNCIIIK